MRKLWRFKKRLDRTQKMCFKPHNWVNPETPSNCRPVAHTATFHETWNFFNSPHNIPKPSLPILRSSYALPRWVFIFCFYWIFLFSSGQYLCLGIVILNPFISSTYVSPIKGLFHLLHFITMSYSFIEYLISKQWTHCLLSKINILLSRATIVAQWIHVSLSKE